MKNEKRYGLFAGFLWQYRASGLMFLLYALIFAVVFSLYELETEAVLYGAGLCILLTAGVLAVKFTAYRRGHQVRMEILENIEVMLEGLQEPKTLAESDYQVMLRKLRRIFEENLSVWQNERRESMDYYTAWVHQIKTPISVMRMMLQGEDTRENRELLAELFRIEQYVEMALSWMRLGSDASDYLFREYELDNIIRQAVRKYAPQFIRNRIRLCYEATDAVVLTDEKWLLFIIEQLLSNAVKYTREGSVTITVTPGKVLQIADTGIGIAPEDMPRIFEKGFTGYNGRADKKSTGLGLYLCRLAADKISCRLGAESVPGRGTTFFIDLQQERARAE